MLDNQKIETRWTVLKRSDRKDNKGQQRYLICKCTCGKVAEVEESSMRRGASKSCGCLRRELTSLRTRTHHLTGSKEYQAWNNARTRCYNSKTKNYKDYGGRGITMCKAWRESFNAFLADMGAAPSPKHTLDRRNNDSNYEPSNCSWELKKVQCRNKRTNFYVQFAGITCPLIEHCERLGLPYKTIHARIKRGWTIAKALTTNVASNK